MIKRLQQLRLDLASRFPERRDVIDGSLCALLASEHVLLFGPPGTAKSALVRALAQAFNGRYFERLLTRFSTPEELFGPISLRALEQDRFARVTTEKLPEAEFAFIDEVFKSNSAILNSLLSLMNERTFANDGAPAACPLVSMFGASNELPDGRELEAMFDRFLLRFDVRYLVTAANFRAVMMAGEPRLSTAMSMADLRAAQAAVSQVEITEATLDVVVEIREACNLEGISASDRRWKKCLGLLKATAFLAGETQTCPEDAAILTDSLWREPKERPKIARIVGKLADPVGTQAHEILDAAREMADRVAALKNGDRKLYIAQAAAGLEGFEQQKTRLAQLAQGAGRRARDVIDQAQCEIQGMYADTARTVSTGLGLRGMR